MIDFSTVTAVNIPEGNVTKISNGSLVLWEGASTPSIPDETIPEDFTRLEYLESTGTQYIDTRYSPVESTRIEVGYEYTSIPTGNFYYVFGNYNSAGKATCRLMTNRSTGKTIINMYTAADQQNFELSSAKVAGTRYDDILTHTSYTTNGTTYEITNTTTGTSNSRDLALFANYVGSNMRKTSLKMYYCRIREGTKLIHNFVPCLDQIGNPCLYDLENSFPYYNDGTGKFGYVL